MKYKYNKSKSGIDYQTDESGNLGIFKIVGALTEQSVGEVKKAIDAIELSNENISYFKLNLENVTAVDLASIHSLYLTCEKLNKRQHQMSLDGLCPVTFTSAVENTGFSHHQWLCFGQLGN